MRAEEHLKGIFAWSKRQRAAPTELGCVEMEGERNYGNCGKGEGQKSDKHSNTWLRCDVCRPVKLTKWSAGTNIDSGGGE